MSGLDRFVGGSVLGTIVKLVVISIAVGLVLAWLNLTPWELIRNLRVSVQEALSRSFGMAHDLVGYFLVGAVIVVPVWVVIRLLKTVPGGRR